MKPKLSIIVAIGKDKSGRNVIGNKNELLWRIPDDLKRFKEITIGHPIIMGRRTYESIGRPLPERTNIIVTRDKTYKVGGCVTTHSIEEAINYAKNIDQEETFIVGGTQIYEQTLPIVNKLYLTRIDDEKKGDSFFPDYSAFTEKTFEEKREHEGLHYTWVTLERPS